MVNTVIGRLFWAVVVAFVVGIGCPVFVILLTIATNAGWV
jgi:hypothetical protein